jgi:hypothetical protein
VQARTIQSAPNLSSLRRAPFPGELLKFFYVLFVDTHGFGYLGHDHILNKNALRLQSLFSVFLRSALPRSKVCGLRPPWGSTGKTSSLPRLMVEYGLDSDA